MVMICAGAFLVGGVLAYAQIKAPIPSLTDKPPTVDRTIDVGYTLSFTSPKVDLCLGLVRFPDGSRGVFQTELRRCAK
jgi:hypothetical protein